MECRQSDRRDRATEETEREKERKKKRERERVESG